MAIARISLNTTGTYPGTHGGAVQDTQLIENQPDYVGGASNDLNLGASAVGANRMNSAFDFPLPADVMSASAINSVTLRLNIFATNSSTPFGLFDAHEIVQAWVEGQASWNNRQTATAWGTAGATGAGDIGAVLGQFVCTAQSGWLAWGSAAMATALNASKASGRFSLLLKRDATNYDNTGTIPVQAVAFNSSNTTDGTRPVLEIDYTPVVLAPTFSGPIPAVTGTAGTSLVALSPTVASYFTGSPTTWTPTPALPAGITLNATTGNPEGTPSAAGTWTGTITGGNGTAPDAVSNSFTITIAAAPTAPSITVQPTNQTAAADSTATFSATATGTGSLTAQWRKNGANVGSAVGITTGVSFSYTTPTLTSGDNGAVYSVVVTGDTAPPATSSNATLTVTASVTPQFSGALALTLLSTTNYTLSWTAATDDVAVTGYERSLNGGTNWTDIGLVLTTNVSGRTPGSTDACRIRAYDIDGNRSAPLARSVTLSLTQVVTEPLENDGGSLHLNAAVKWSWFPGGRMGAMEGITPLDGTGTTHATVGNLVIDGLPLGPGVLMTCVWGATPDLDSVHYQYLTVV